MTFEEAHSYLSRLEMEILSRGSVPIRVALECVEHDHVADAWRAAVDYFPMLRVLDAINHPLVTEAFQAKNDQPHPPYPIDRYHTEWRTWQARCADAVREVLPVLTFADVVDFAAIERTRAKT